MPQEEEEKKEQKLKEEQYEKRNKEREEKFQQYFEEDLNLSFMKELFKDFKVQHYGGNYNQRKRPEGGCYILELNTEEDLFRNNIYFLSQQEKIKIKEILPIKIILQNQKLKFILKDEKDDKKVIKEKEIELSEDNN